MLKNTTRAELIGKEVEIVKAKNKSLNNMKGKIIDETRNMVMVQTDSGVKRVIKDQASFRIKSEKDLIEIEGIKLVNRPEDRLKRVRKK